MATVLITGGSRGIGAATARLFATNGYDVCLTFRTQHAAAERVASEVTRLGRRAVTACCDVAHEPDVLQLFERFDQELGPIDVLVNNAGILDKQCRCEAVSAERLHRVLSVNVVGAFLCAREAVRRMSTKFGGAGGAIVNVSSAASRLGSPGEYVDYAASKGAIDSMTIGLAKEVGPEGIRVNAVRPAFIETDIHASGGEPGRVERVASGLPMRRGGKADEVAQAIYWLGSHLSSYVTGSFIEMSGGV